MGSVPKAGTANASHCLPRDWRSRFTRTSSQKGSVPKAFQDQTSFALGFFAPRLFTKASFRHSLETKKPLICMRGFVERTGIEPVLPGWKPGVLTVRRTLHRRICHSGRKNRILTFYCQIILHIFSLKINFRLALNGECSCGIHECVMLRNPLKRSTVRIKHPILLIIS